ncbi:MAG: DpnD/PcfM family protein [Ruminococcus sp.]|nr:DpnD/PcfM family protein [Ruminococcus sp.]
MIGYMTASEAAQKWNISHRRVITLCSENRISNVAMLGNMWIIPSDAEKPIDARKTIHKKSNNMIFKVTIEETVSETYDIEASSVEEAQKIAIKKYNNNEIVLEPGNIISKRISVCNSTFEKLTDFEDF